MSRLRTPALLALAAATVGCPAVDVVVAEQQAADDGGEAGLQDAGPQTCTQPSDCSAAEYCDKAGCGATAGVCALRPPTCPDTEADVCGCDGVVYWNDCLRRRDGVASSTMGQCAPHIARCGGPKDNACPVADAVCARLDLSGQGGCVDLGGVCWVLPDSCPEDAGGPRFAACGPPPLSCSDLCDALRSQRLYARRDQCP